MNDDLLKKLQGIQALKERGLEDLRKGSRNVGE